MSEIILEFFKELPKELYVFTVSLFPIVELRGAIPLGAALGMPFYTNYICSVVGNLVPVPFILLFISKMLDLLARFKMTRPVVKWLRSKADKHSSKVLKDGLAEATVSTDEEITDTAVATDIIPESALCGTTSEVTNGAPITGETEGDTPCVSAVRKMTPAVFWALMFFVAIPLPGTGAWTGSLVASLFNLPKKKSFLAVVVGVLASGTIMCLAS